MTAQTMTWEDRMKIHGDWNQLKGRVREEWAEITDQEMEEARGNWEQFVGTIQRKTGETAEAVQEKLDDMTS